VAQVKGENPQAVVQLWSQDEARFGLQPIIKKRWSKIGTRPGAQVNPQYEWTWSYGAVEMATGESFALDLAEFTSSFGGDIFTRVCCVARVKQGEDRHSAVGWRTGTPGEVESPGRNSAISNTAAHAGVKSKRKIMVAVKRSSRQSNICRD